MRVQLDICTMSQKCYDTVLAEFKRVYGDIEFEDWRIDACTGDLMECNCGAPVPNKDRVEVCDNCSNVLYPVGRV